LEGKLGGDKRSWIV